MKIKSLNIKNYKSLVDVIIEEPNNFSVFVGPNASGKSNIFEAIEIVDFIQNDNVFEEVFNIYGEYDELLNRKMSVDEQINFRIVGNIDHEQYIFNTYIDQNNARNYPLMVFSNNNEERIVDWAINNLTLLSSLFNNFQRLFIGRDSQSHHKFKAGRVLDYSASNLPLVLKRLINNDETEELSELLNLFIPGFKRIKVYKDELSGDESLTLYDKNYEKPFARNLISDGTYNILALITAVLQSDEPQFLLIEEPENGLNPKAIKELVHFFREQCEEKGHYIWLATHSQSLVSELKLNELIIVDKQDGETKIKQFRDKKVIKTKKRIAILNTSTFTG
ncbi:MAG: AAA family ATPase [Bacteroidota bacterium]|nr:AAA family ATPase [Bacteroidota bacterium]